MLMSSLLNSLSLSLTTVQNVSSTACHATIRFKNSEFIFMDAASSNESYLHRPVELTPSRSVQLYLGRSMISMKVVNKWNQR